jgi:dolichol kinase
MSLVNVLATAAAYSVLFLLGESAFRLFRVAPQVTRPGLHFACSVVSVLVPFWLTQAEIVGLALFFAAGMLVSMRISLLRSIHGVARAGWGEAFFPLGIALAALLYLPANQHIYSMAILVLGISDPLANIVGHKATGVWATKLLFGKTVGGSLAFFASSTAVCLAFLPAPQALLVSSLLTVIETISPLGSDNLTIIAGSVVALI